MTKAEAETEGREVLSDRDEEVMRKPREGQNYPENAFNHKFDHGSDGEREQKYREKCTHYNPKSRRNRNRELGSQGQFG